MFNVKISEQDLNNLKIFLDRVTLTGKEVVAYSMVLEAIYRATPEDQSIIKAGE